MHDDDEPQAEPDPDGHHAMRAARRAIVFEETLRAATGFMVVVFSVSLVTAFPFVPDWVFTAALGAVVLSVPAAISVRMRLLDPDDSRDPSQLWSAALVGTGTIGLILALLAVLAQTVALGTGLVRLGGVMAALLFIAYLRGWRPSESQQVQDHAEEHG